MRVTAGQRESFSVKWWNAMGTQSRLTHLCETAKLSNAQKRTILLVFLVEPRGVEPLTSSLRTRRSPN